MIVSMRITEFNDDELFDLLEKSKIEVYIFGDFAEIVQSVSVNTFSEAVVAAQDWISDNLTDASLQSIIIIDPEVEKPTWISASGALSDYRRSGYVPSTDNSRDKQLMSAPRPLRSGYKKSRRTH